MEYVDKNGNDRGFVTHRWYKEEEEDPEESKKIIEEMVPVIERGIVKHVDLYISKQERRTGGKSRLVK